MDRDDHYPLLTLVFQLPSYLYYTKLAHDVMQSAWDAVRAEYKGRFLHGDGTTRIFFGGLNAAGDGMGHGHAVIDREGTSCWPFLFMA